MRLNPHRLIQSIVDRIAALFKGKSMTPIYEITENLFQSGRLGDNPLPLVQNGILTVVDLEGGFDSRVFEPLFDLYVYWPIVDGPLPDPGYLNAIATLILWSINTGKKVLIHCGEGINRASLVVGYVLHLKGYTGNEIIQKIISKRPGALTNEKFFKYLQSL